MEFDRESLRLAFESIAEVVRKDCRDEFIGLIKEQMEKSGNSTGHGKSQQAFGRKLLYEMGIDVWGL